MKDDKLVLMIIIIFLGCVGLTSLFYSFYMVKEVRLVPMDLKVDTYVGINIDTDMLYFGTTFPGGGAMRNIAIDNKNDIPLMVHVIVSGDLENWAGPSENDFILQPNEARNITFGVTVPSDAEYGNYKGNAKFIFKRISLFS